MKDDIIENIGGIGNYYGGLCIKKDTEDKCYWGIENYDGINWKEIPHELFNTLKDYHD